MPSCALPACSSPSIFIDEFPPQKASVFAHEGIKDTKENMVLYLFFSKQITLIEEGIGNIIQIL